MKKIINLMLMGCGMLLVNTSLAQGVTISPSVFTAIDPVTITIDVTNTPMAGETDAYLWIWSNVGDGITNGSWGNSSNDAKLTPAGTNKWSYTFTGVDLFNSTPAQLTQFGLLVKAKDGSKQTSDFQWFKFDPLVFTATKLRVFPAKVGVEDVVTVNFHQDMAENVNEERMAVESATIELLDATNNIIDTKDFAAKKEGNIWSATFIPNYSFTIPAGVTADKFRFRFNGKVKNPSNQDVQVSTNDSEVQFSKLK